jgi:CRP-like cAMP-binding protein
LIDIHLRKLRARDEISDAEEAAIRAAVSGIITVEADKTIIKAGSVLDRSTLLLEGIMCRFKDLKSGERQITELHVAGDFVDLHSFTLKRLDHSIMTLTPCTFATVPHDRLAKITEEHPHLTRVYWFNTNMDAAIHREWEVSLGRRTSLSKVASLLCELHIRLGIVGLSRGDEYDLPLTQTDLAECLGLTQIHVNRTLRELRIQGLVEFRGGVVRIVSMDRLIAVAEFDPSYLYLERRAR